MIKVFLKTSPLSFTNGETEVQRGGSHMPAQHPAHSQPSGLTGQALEMPGVDQSGAASPSTELP